MSSVNVASSVRIGTKGRHKEPVKIPTKAEVKSLMAKLDELATDKRWRRWRVLFATAINSGFRASELRGLPWDAVDLKLEASSPSNNAPTSAA